jgi:hypothetical protein
MNSKHEQDRAPNYLSYLVRLWRVEGKGEARDQGWRASLEEPLTQRIQRFEDLQSLFKFLQGQVGQDNQ